MRARRDGFGCRLGRREPSSWPRGLIAFFPANVYAALSGVTLRGQPATALWLRTLMQIIWIAALWWSTIPGPVARPRRELV